MMHYYPQLKLEDMSVEDFAYWSENAEWMHNEMLLLKQANSVAALGGGPS